MTTTLILFKEVLRILLKIQVFRVDTNSIRKHPDIIFDSAHNPEGVSSFLSEFNKDIKKYSKKVLLFGAMRDKDVEYML